MPVRVTTLAAYVYNATGAVWQSLPGVYAASLSFGFDQRYAEATLQTTVAGGPSVTYWDKLRVDLGCTPGAGVTTRFVGYLVPLDNALYPIQGTLHCRGLLYRTAWVRNTQRLGTPMAPVGGGGVTDQQQVTTILTSCGLVSGTDFTPANIGGTGKLLGSLYTINYDSPLTPGPFTWGNGETGLSYIEKLDEVSVPDDHSGRYRTFETLAGDIYRIALSTTPKNTPDFSFTEGVDVLEARITRDPEASANRVTVTGAALPNLGGIPGVIDARYFIASAPAAPYFPPGVPNGPDGYPEIAQDFASPLIEKSQVADTGNALACEAVARFLLGEYNCVLDTLTFSTPRDDLLGPGQTVHLTSPRLGIPATDTTTHYWVQRLDVEVDERGQLTQRVTGIRKS